MRTDRLKISLKDIKNSASRILTDGVVSSIEKTLKIGSDKIGNRFALDAKRCFDGFFRQAPLRLQVIGQDLASLEGFAHVLTQHSHLGNRNQWISGDPLQNRCQRVV